jgi:hypothetical protein
MNFPQRQRQGRPSGRRPGAPPPRRQKVAGEIVWPPAASGSDLVPQSADIQALGPDGSVLGSQVRNRPQVGLVALREPWEFDLVSRDRVSALRIRFHAEPAAGGAVLRMADAAIPRGGKGQALVVAAGGAVARVSLTVLGPLDIGTDSLVIVTAWDKDGRAVAVDPGAVSVRLEGADPVVGWADGRLRGLRPGLATLRAEAVGVRGEMVKVGVGEAVVRLQASGLRGPIAIEADRSGPWLLRTDQPAALTVRWELEKGLQAPQRVADRQFAGWFVGKQRVGDKPNLLRLPAMGPDDILVAKYSPSLPRQGFVPNFKRPDHGYWSSLPRTFRMDDTVVGQEREIVREAMLRWHAATGGLVGLVEAPGSELEDVLVSFGELPPDRDGETTTTGITQRDGRVLLRRARIILSERLRRVRAEDRDASLAQVACHEAGHALGIFSSDKQGHSPTGQDVMSPRVAQRLIWPTPRDLNTLASLYPNLFPGTAAEPKRR